MSGVDAFEELTQARAMVLGRLDSALAPEIGVILGSGLGSWAETLDQRVSVPYGEIPGMPVSTVVGHAGNLVLGRVPGGATTVACLQGRVHTYEGHEQCKVVFGARLLAFLGCKAVLLTNAAGGVRNGFVPGDLMLLSDHLNLVGRSPLVGLNDDRLGVRFPDMTEAYDPELRRLAHASAAAAATTLHEGVYAALLGPTYETPAEVRMLRALGADAVGMSTAPEVIALRHMGVACGAISCITNLAAGLGATKLDHSEVEAIARASRERFTRVLSGWAERAGAWARDQASPPAEPPGEPG